MIRRALLVLALGAVVAGAQSRNDAYVDPDLDLERMTNVLERETREVFGLREEIVAAIGIEAGDVVADVGAGTGAFLDLFVDAVGPTGHVFAVEISAPFVEHLRARADEEGHANVTVVLSSFTSATLPRAAVDRIVVVDTYHHFDDHEAMLASMHAALRPGGAMVIVDFDRIDGVSRPWILSHVRDSKATFRAEIEAAGFTFEQELEIPGMSDNFVHIYRRP